MSDLILIVDDNEDILDFLSEIFCEKYEVLTAEDGKQALTMLSENVIDLIISDIMMPEIDGFEFCKEVKSNIDYCHIPLILLTSKNTYQAKIDGLEVGADAYVQKPFSPDFLMLQAANLLKNRVKIRAHFASAPFEDTRVMAHSKSDELFLKKLDEYVQQHIDDLNLDIDQLAYHMNMSRPTFYRKVKAISKISPKELVNIARLKKAVRLIAENQYKLFEIAQMVGYSSQSIFGKNFQKHYGMTPIEYAAQLKSRES
ncbi:response regulator transcription factor [Pedobacter endophyticus]|uniref:Response regulator n=1 Tax=Pedobacter endophyticus TaxID=2789740 RepID=A0A7S9Q055_9SPHI|nr:response regulator [Pedobacter endophyticus]QPH40371.1 response regulator [Pedobacter endophyticus]